MKILKNINALSLVCLVISFGILSSCDDDESANSGQVELLSFGPSGVTHGEQITFIGNNLNKVTSIELAGASVESSSFVEQTSERIVIVVPDEATEGKVTLKTVDGDIVSKTVLSFEVPVTITSITQEARPESLITITGEFMNWVKEVSFADGLTVSVFESQSLTELVVKVPKEAKTGRLTFATGGTEPLTIVTENDFMVTLPAVSEFSPSSIKHSENLTIIGTDMDLVKEIRFEGGAVMSQFVSQTTDQIVVQVPNTTESGIVTLIVFSLIEVPSDVALGIILPIATSLSPVPATPGTDITLVGTDLDLVKEIIFPNVQTPVTSFISQSATEIVVTSPAEAMSGFLLFVTHLGFQSNSGILFQTPGEGPLPLAEVIFDDALQNGFGDWGYGGVTDKSNSEMVLEGSIAVKKTFDASWDAVRFAGSSISTSGMTEFTFSVFGGPGTDGKVANVIINNNWGIKTITITEGEWVEHKFTMADFADPASIDDWGLQAQGWAGSIYIDHVGLR